MLDAPQLILIGSSGQNAGKTTLAKALIKTWKGRVPIVALKITSVAQHGAVCPRGGAGCGACVTIARDFVLEEEQGASPNKDTAQLLQAGASQVFWLRSLYGSLAAGYAHFLEQIPPKGLIIGESNSLREVVLPGCFIML
ncbi:MAG: molybdopterin-guanine dinucleotide biosynthesis protein B, partial [Treponema sp.]|nr:molybdopterin-guanine dinucleotide biosynthesis protein B [Treponema sp.]